MAKKKAAKKRTVKKARGAASIETTEDQPESTDQPESATTEDQPESTDQPESATTENQTAADGTETATGEKKSSGRPLQYCEECKKGTKTRAGKCVEMRDGKECGWEKPKPETAKKAAKGKRGRPRKDETQPAETKSAPAGVGIDQLLSAAEFLKTAGSRETAIQLLNTVAKIRS